MSKIKYWQVKKLGEICEIITGSTPSKSKPEYYGDSYPFFKPSDFDKSYFLQSAKDNLSILGIQKARFLPKKSVLVVCIGSIGKVGLTRAEGSCNQQINAIIANNELISPEFVYFYAISSKFQNLLKETSSATTLAILNKSKFENLEIPLPSLDEQNLIVKKIESCFEKIDFAISNFKKSKELIEIYKQSVLSHAFNGKLTNSNLNSWQVKKLGEISMIKGGRRLPKGAKFSHDKTDYPYIRVVDFENMTIDASKLKYISCEIQNKIKHYTISKDDTYISIAGTIGKSGYIPDCLNGANLTENAAKIIHKENKYFLAYFLNSLNGQQQIKNFTKATTQAKLALYRIEQIKIPLPPLSEQNLIVAQIGKRFKVADNALNLIEQNLKKAEILKQSILSKAFNGELVKDKNE